MDYRLITRAAQLAAFGKSKAEVLQELREDEPISDSLFHWVWLAVIYKPKELAYASSGQDTFKANFTIWMQWSPPICGNELCDSLAVARSLVDGQLLCSVCEEIDMDHFREEYEKCIDS